MTLCEGLDPPHFDMRCDVTSVALIYFSVVCTYDYDDCVGVHMILGDHLERRKGENDNVNMESDWRRRLSDGQWTPQFQTDAGVWEMLMDGEYK